MAMIREPVPKTLKPTCLYHHMYNTVQTSLLPFLKVDIELNVRILLHLVRWHAVQHFT